MVSIEAPPDVMVVSLVMWSNTGADVAPLPVASIWMVRASPPLLVVVTTAPISEPSPLRFSTVSVKDARPEDVRWVHDKLAMTLAGLAFELGCGEPAAFEHAAEAARNWAATIAKTKEQGDAFLDAALLRAARLCDGNAAVIKAIGKRLAETSFLDGVAIRWLAGNSGFPFREASAPGDARRLKWRPSAGTCNDGRPT